MWPTLCLQHRCLLKNDKIKTWHILLVITQDRFLLTNELYTTNKHDFHRAPQSPERSFRAATTTNTAPATCKHKNSPRLFIKFMKTAASAPPHRKHGNIKGLDLFEQVLMLLFHQTFDGKFYGCLLHGFRRCLCDGVLTSRGQGRIVHQWYWTIQGLVLKM